MSDKLIEVECPACDRYIEAKCFGDDGGFELCYHEVDGKACGRAGKRYPTEMHHHSELLFGLDEERTTPSKMAQEIKMRFQHEHVLTRDDVDYLWRVSKFLDNL